MNRQPLIDIFKAALSAADPYRAVLKAVTFSKGTMIIGGNAYHIDAFDRIIAVGAGKGTALMAKAVETILGGALQDGIIIVKYGHTSALKKIRRIEASHPLPDEAGVQGTEKIIAMLESADEKTLVLCLLSGGGSALLVSPVDDITLAEKRRITDLLLKSGATIDELNTVRKHLSKVKGGRLARIAHPATVISLVLSDVIGDRLDVIASGPTVPDGTTFADALRVIEKYGLRERIPARIAAFFDAGLAGGNPETPKAGDPCFTRTTNVIVGSLTRSLYAAREAALDMGLDADVVTSELQGEARDAARRLAEVAIAAKKSLKGGRPKCLLSGGETTVTVRGTGSGGRNQELALAFALAIEGTDGLTMLSAGTDGTDGPTDAAGAVVDGTTASKARTHGIDPEASLDNNDSYTFFQRLDALTGEEHHLRTGPTGTNVMDVQIICINGNL